MEIRILELIEGAKLAEGLTVVIDVFRAFSLECYLYGQGAERIHPVGSLEEAFRLKSEHPDWVLFGERKGARVPGCEYGNSPSSIAGVDFSGKTLIHTTSAGTQGIVNAVHASEIVTGSLVNAAAIAEYIRRRQPEVVSLVAMGKAGLARAEEDLLCAEYIRSLLLDEAFPIDRRMADLRNCGGEHFFRPETQEIYPEADFALCTRRDAFPFVIRVSRGKGLYTTERFAT